MVHQKTSQIHTNPNSNEYANRQGWSTTERHHTVHIDLNYTITSESDQDTNI